MDIMLPNELGKFDLALLVEYIKSSGRNFIVIGKQKSSLINHTKPHSLDYWARQFSKSQNGFTATERLVLDLVETRILQPIVAVCPDSGRKCRALMLVVPDQY